jgi:hypothetical protein
MMPYIKREDREFSDPYSREFARGDIATAGQLNYAITMLIKEALGPTPNYDAINSVVGVLECAKQEVYRRVAAPYEDKKKKENGDVY